MNNMTRHERTVLMEGLFNDYNWFERSLVFIGLERLVVFLRGQKVEGVNVKPAHDVMSDEFPLACDGIEYD